MDALSPPKKFPRLNRKPARKGIAEFGQHLDFNKLMMRDKNEFNKFLKFAYPVIQEAVAHLGYLKNNTMHEDCMQEVAILLYRNIDTYRGDGNIKGWIYAIAQNYGIDIIRRKNRRRLLDEDLQYLLKDDQDVEDPEFITRGRELEEIIKKKIGKLPMK